MQRGESVMPVRKISPVFCALLCLWVAGTGGDSVKTHRISIRGRCECVEYAERVIPRNIVNIIAVSEPNWSCSETEIILKMRRRKVCLNPDSEQGQKMQECWSSHEKNPENTKKCFKQKAIL